MRSGYFYSFIFALLASTSVAAVAAPGGPSQATTPQAINAVPKTQSDKVYLNQADAPTLQRDLFGIGAAKAKAIIAYRETNGPFTAIDELLEVKGIGKALLEKNRDRLEVN